MFSVGYSQLEQVRTYILDQEKHHLQLSFQYEFRLFLKRYSVGYDERYVWD
jgi:putative transposase